jgi:hypothetical protein
MPPSRSIRDLIGVEKCGGWPIQHVKSGYTIKADTATRKTVVLAAPVRIPSTVDLWLIEGGHPELADVILARDEYREIEVIARSQIVTTSPQLFAIIWTFPKAVIETALKGRIDSKLVT